MPFSVASVFLFATFALEGIALRDSPARAVAALAAHGYRNVEQARGAVRAFQILPALCASEARSRPAPLPIGARPYAGACTGTIVARGPRDPHLAIAFAEDPARPGSSIVKSIELTLLYDPRDTAGRTATQQRLETKFGAPAQRSVDALGHPIDVWCAGECASAKESLTFSEYLSGRILLEDRDLEAADRAQALKRIGRP